MYLYRYFLFLCWFHKHGVHHKNVCVVSIWQISVSDLSISHRILLEIWFSDEATDPVSQPIVWIRMWVDYWDKYKFDYHPYDEGLGVVLNDSTKTVLLAKQKWVFLHCVIYGVQSHVHNIFFLWQFCVLQLLMFQTPNGLNVQHSVSNSVSK